MGDECTMSAISGTIEVEAFSDPRASGLACRARCPFELSDPLQVESKPI
jgi:hypothetical protein